MADTSVVDLDTDFVGFWWGDLDVLDGEIFAGFPSNGSLYERESPEVIDVKFNLYLASNGLHLTVSNSS